MESKGLVFCISVKGLYQRLLIVAAIIFVFSLGMATAVFAADIYVDTGAAGGNNGGSWTDAFTDLQAALAAASGGDTIYVAQGTYKPTAGSDRTATFQLKNGVTLMGGYPAGGGKRAPKAHVTILSGDIGTVSDNTDNSYHVVTGSGTDDTAVLNGFTITAGNADSAFPYNDGGGMYVGSGGPKLINVTFSGNRADAEGGGMCGIGTLRNVTFSGNTAGTDGGGMWGNGTLRNVTFSGNSAYSGGGMYVNGGSPKLTNVTFSGNTASGEGGGIYVATDVSPKLTNVTFSGNSANSGGGICNASDRTVKMFNTILWGNTPDQVYNQKGVTQISDSVVQDGYAGGTNIITGDPNLGALGDYGGYTQTIPLLTGSSAIDTGNAAYAPNADQRGVSRPQGAGYDIGAYEASLYSVTPSAGANGSIDPDTERTVYYEGTVSLNIRPAAGYHVVTPVGGTCGGAYTGDPSDSANGIIYTTGAVIADCTVSATFEINRYKVTPSAGPGGTISPDTAQTVDYDKTKSFTITPNPGYHIVTPVGGTCGGTLSGDTYTTDAVTADCTVDAEFAYVTSFTVNPTSDSDCSDGDCDLQSALIASSYVPADVTVTISGDTYTVAAPYLYKPGTTPFGTDNHALTIRGQGKGKTILDGGKNVQVLVIDTTGLSDDSAAGIMLEGFTLKRGVNSYASQGGGGLAARTTTADITVSKCRFLNNAVSSSGVGGGAALNSEGGGLSVLHCVFSGNSGRGRDPDGGGALVYSAAGNVAVRNSTFKNNTLTGHAGIYGGGLYARSDSGTVAITGNTFQDNTASTNNSANNDPAKGGGLLAYSGSKALTLRRNLFDGNAASSSSPTPSSPTSGGGAAVENDSGKTNIQDNIFSGNQSTGTGATAGGIGVATGKKNLAFINNTINGNTAVQAGGGSAIGLTRNAASADIYNNIIWNNQAAAGADLYVDSDADNDGTGSAVSLFNNDFSSAAVITDEDNLTSGSDKSTDPLFISASDFHLQDISPCINAGDNAAPSLPALDFDGKSRVLSGTVDMGAYENADQTITVTENAPSSAVYNTTFEVTATATSGLPVSITATGPCSGSGTGSATITMTDGAGTCIVHYNQAGDSDYNAAAEVTETVNAQRADQAALTLNAGSPLTYNATETLSTSGGSGIGTVSYQVTSGNCTTSGDQLKADGGTGTCSVKATKAADSDYNAAMASGTVTLQKAGETITVTQHAPSNAVYGTAFDVSATASSGLGVAITTSGSCSGSGTGSATITMSSGTGSCTVRYSQAGNGDYGAAPDVTETTAAAYPSHVVLPDATGNGNITLDTNSPGCGFMTYSAETEAQVGDDRAFDYPYGIVNFSVSCASADVTITFPGSVNGMTYRKYGPTTPGDPATTCWYTFGATITGDRVTLHLQDGQLGDDIAGNGTIEDAGGAGRPAAKEAVAVPAMTGRGVILFSLLAALVSVYYLKKRRCPMR